MTRDQDLINSITEWLEDQPERAPDRLLDSVLTDLRTAPQRAPWRLPFRRFPMLGSNLARYGALAAVAAVTVIVAVGLWTGRGLPVGGPGDSPAPTPTSVAMPTTALAPTSAATPTTTLPATAVPSPVMLRGQGPLAAGVHFHEANGSCSEPNGMRITLEVPAGWANGVACEVSKAPVEGSGRPVSLSYHQSVVVYVDPCRPEAGVKPTETVDDLATALADVPPDDVTLVTSPTDTTIGGFRGKHLAWALNAFDPEARPPRMPGCGMGVSWHPDSMGRGFEFGRHQDVWILDVAGAQLVINAEYYLGDGLGDETLFPATSDADRAELQAVIDSIEIEALDE